MKIMWLPKDERKLLAFYFQKIGKPHERETFGNKEQTFNDEIKVLGWCEKRKYNHTEYDEYVRRFQFVCEMLNLNNNYGKRQFL